MIATQRATWVVWLVAVVTLACGTALLERAQACPHCTGYGDRCDVCSNLVAFLWTDPVSGCESATGVPLPLTRSDLVQDCDIFLTDPEKDGGHYSGVDLYPKGTDQPPPTQPVTAPCSEVIRMATSQPVFTTEKMIITLCAGGIKRCFFKDYDDSKTLAQNAEGVYNQAEYQPFSKLDVTVKVENSKIICTGANHQWVEKLIGTTTVTWHDPDDSVSQEVQWDSTDPQSPAVQMASSGGTTITGTTLSADRNVGHWAARSAMKKRRNANATTIEYVRQNENGMGQLTRKRVTTVTINSDGSKSFSTKIFDYFYGRLVGIVSPDRVVAYLKDNPTASGVNPAINSIDGDPLASDGPVAYCDLDSADLSSYRSVAYNYDGSGRLTSVESLAGGGCCGCGGGAAGTVTYSYTSTLVDDPSGYDEANRWTTAWRTQTKTDTLGLRRKETYNFYDRLIKVEESTDGANWTTISTTTYYYDQPYRAGRVQYRTSTIAGQTVTWQYDYHNPSGEVLWEKVKYGTNTWYLLRNNTYPATADPDGLYHVRTETVYPTETVTDTGGYTTTYSYDSWSGTVLTQMTVTHPKVSTTNHGPGDDGGTAATRLIYHYAQISGYSSMPYYNDYTQHEDDSFNRTTQDEFGNITSTIEESPSHDQLTTSYTYDSCGHLSSVTHPGGLTEKYAYLAMRVRDNESAPTSETTTGLVTLRAPFVDANGHYDYQPVEITISSLDGKVLTSAAGVANTNQDGDLTNDWDPTQTTVDQAFLAKSGTQLTSRTDNIYGTSSADYNVGKLVEVRRYHTMPATAGQAGSLGTNYYRTYYKYDSNSRRTHQVQVLAGTDSGSTESVTKTVYDVRGRATETDVGTCQNMPTLSSYSDPTLVKVSSTDYSEDGVVNDQKSYFGSGANDYFQTTNHYDYRGRVDQVRSTGNVTTKRTFDNMDRTIQEDTYVDANTDWVIGSGELYARTTTLYDQKGQVYQTSACEINSSHSDGTGTTLTTGYWYDSVGRLVKTKDPTGMFAKTTYDGFGRASAAYACYDTAANEPDTDYAQACNAESATHPDTIVRVTVNEYDSAGRVIREKQGITAANAVILRKYWYTSDWTGTGAVEPYMTGVSSRKANDNTSDNDSDYNLTKYEYDSAGNQYGTIMPAPDTTLVETKAEGTYDALGRVLTSKTYKNDGGWVLLSQSTMGYGSDSGTTTDNVNTHMTHSRQYAVDSSGTAGHYLETVTDYNGYGRIYQIHSPSGEVNKTVCDAYGRVNGTYLCTSVGSDPTTVSGDVVIEQTVPSYDTTTGAVWLTTTAQRKDNTSDATTGGLTTSTGRVSYVVQWFDGVGHVTKTINYGTNDGTAITDKSTSDFDPETSGTQDYDHSPAPNTSAKYVVAVGDYDGFGRLYQTTDNAGRKTRSFFDSMGRLTHVAENYDNFNPADDSGTGDSTDHAKDRVTKYVYNNENMVTQQIALDANGDGNLSDNQVTRYVYAIELTDKGCNVPTNDRLRAVIYGDSDDTVSGSALANGTDSTYDRVEMTYYADGSLKTRKDQRQVQHTYNYDCAYRQVADCVTACPTGNLYFDTTILCIGRTYGKDGSLLKVTSYDAASTSGNVKNEVAFGYDDWGNVRTSWQDHSTTATTSGGSQSPNVQYGYEDGATGNAALYIRLHTVTYPSGPTGNSPRVVYYNYPSSGIGQTLSRLGDIADGDGGSRTRYAKYDYFGAATIYKEEHPAVTGGLNLVYGAGDGTYSGLDRFGRVVDQLWQTDGGTPTILDEYQYGYDNNSNRLYRKNVVAENASKAFDELYHADNPTAGTEYDGLNRLKEWRRGTLDAQNDGLTGSAAKYQTYTLDALGNWSGFNDNGTSQTRTHNSGNEMTAVNGSSTNWVYDQAGNMIRTPAGSNYRVYTYDAWNRLISMLYYGSAGPLMASGGASPMIAVGGKFIYYRYDGLNRRISKAAATTNAMTTFDRTDYYYNENWQVLEERFNAAVSGSDTLATTLLAQWLWGQRYIDAPVVRWRDDNGDGTFNQDGETLYYLNDANMNVTAVIKPDGTILERYVYDAYGTPTIYDSGWANVIGWTNSKVNEVLYCGYRYDWESGFYQVRNRVYNPGLGRWMQRDPAGFVDGMNRYQYVRSSPGSGTDWDGNRLYVVHDDRQKFGQKVIDSYKTLCPCVAYDKTIVDKGGLVTDGDVKNKDLEPKLAKFGMQTSAVRASRVTCSRSKETDVNGDDVSKEEGFCNCVKKSPAGCRLVHDLTTADDTHNLIVLTMDNIQNGHAIRIGRFIIITWAPGYNGPPQSPSGTPDTTLGHESTHAEDFLQDGSGHYSAPLWGNMVDAQTAAVAKVDRTQTANQNQRRAAARNAVYSDYTETWAVQGENQVGNETYGREGKVYNSRIIYGDGVTLTDPTKPHVTTPTQDEIKEWWKTLEKGWGG